MVSGFLVLGAEVDTKRNSGLDNALSDNEDTSMSDDDVSDAENGLREDNANGLVSSPLSQRLL